MKSQRSACKQAIVTEDLRAEDCFSTSLASLAGVLVTRRAAPEMRNNIDSRERQPDGETAA